MRSNNFDVKVPGLKCTEVEAQTTIMKIKPQYEWISKIPLYR